MSSIRLDRVPGRIATIADRIKRLEFQREQIAQKITFYKAEAASMKAALSEAKGK